MAEKIIDTHLHLWDTAKFRYGWLDGFPLLNRNYLVEDFQKASAGCGVVGGVFVQCDCAAEESIAEAQWVASLVKKGLAVQGIVAHAPVELGASVRSHLVELARIPLVHGIRRLLQGEKKAGVCLQPSFIAGVQALAEFKFSFDICVRRDQLADAIALVRACPQVSFVLDHFGNPDIKNKIMEPWRAQITELSQLPNVCCKLSGIVTVADDKNWTPEDLTPYVDQVISSFGSSRVLFGGDWPVVLLASEYRRWVETVHLLLAKLPAIDRQKILHDNAVKVYRLN
jgi:L-fuconolactonase